MNQSYKHNNSRRSFSVKKTIVLMLTVVSWVLLLTGCSDNDAPFIQKSYEADGTQIKEVKINVRDREIAVTVSADNQIHIDYFENKKEYYDISVSEDKVLTMTGKSDKKWTDYIGSNSDAGFGKISLQIPGSMLVNLTLTTTNKDIEISSVTVDGNVSLSVNGGDIIFDKINVGKNLTLTGKNGNISGTIIGSYDDFSILTEIKKGESNLPSNKANGSKILDVKNNNGDIDIEFVQN